MTERRLGTLFGAGTATGLTDGQLLDRFASRRDEGAEAAFEALVERHRAMVLHVCRGVLGASQDVEDAFQATFLVLARQAGSIRKRESVGPWLHGVALRVSARARAEAARRRAHERRAAVGGARGDAPEVDQGLAAVLHEELARLPEKHRDPVVLCYLEGLSHEQAAARLGWPVGTVKTRLGRARETLRSRLTRRGLAPASAAVLASLTPQSTPAGTISTLAGSSVRAIFRSAIGRAATAEAVSARVVTLASAAAWASRIEKLRSAATVMAASLALVASSGTLIGYTRADPDDPEVRFAAFLRTVRPSPGVARKTVPNVPARYAAPGAAAGAFEAAPGWSWLVVPTPERLDGDSLGFSIGASGSNAWTLDARAIPGRDGSIVIRLIHPVGPHATTIPECRPVVFDVEGKRHLPVLERRGVCTDEEGRAVALSRFRLDPGLLDLSALRHIGYERISPAAPPDAVREAKAWSGDAAWRPPLGSAEGFATEPGYAWLIAPSRVSREGWVYAASGANGGVICDVMVDRNGTLEVTLAHPGKCHSDLVPEYRFVAFDAGRNRRLIDVGEGGFRGDSGVTTPDEGGRITEHLCSHGMQVPEWQRPWSKDRIYLSTADVSYVGVERASRAAQRDAQRKFRAEFLEFQQALRAADEIQESELRSTFWLRRKLAGCEAEDWRERYERVRDAAMANAARRKTGSTDERPAP